MASSLFFQPLLPGNPGFQRDHHHLSRSPVPSSYVQRDPLADFPWMWEELEQQRGSQVHNQNVSKALVDMELHDTSQMRKNHLLPPSYSNLTRRPQQFTGSSSAHRISSKSAREVPEAGGYGVQSEAPYEEAVAWYRSISHFRPDSPTRGSGQMESPQGVEGPSIRVGPQAHGEGSYTSKSRMDVVGIQSPHSASVSRFDQNITSGMETDSEARFRWEHSMPSPDDRFVESSEAHFEALIQNTASRPYRTPSPLLIDSIAGPPSPLLSAGTPNTSVSSGSTSDGADYEESNRNDVPSKGGEGASSGKRKTPEPSGEDGDDSARTSEVELKKTASANRTRKKANMKRLREPRYAIKTRTDVDIMDDGFKWRKYGQKAVKNSPHPRNYYRCTTPQCPVRKRVERSSEDSGLVITTYEGTHTHQTPGFQRSATGGYYGERPPLGLGGGLYLNPGQIPLGPIGFGPRSNLLPLPPEFSLTALHHLRSQQENTRLQSLAQQQRMITPSPIGQQLPGSVRRESILRAQHLLSLQNPAFRPVKQEPIHFAAQDYMTRGTTHALPYQSRQVQHPGSTGAQFIDRLRAMRPEHIRPRGPPPASPLSGADFSNFPQQRTTLRTNPTVTDSDLVRRVLQAEELEREQDIDIGQRNSNIEDDPRSESFNHRGASPQDFVSQDQSNVSGRELDRLRAQQRSQNRPMRRRVAGDPCEDLPGTREPIENVVEGLLQDMMRPGGPNPFR